MAKMSGVELKSVKYATGMEGGFFQGNVYLDGKKIGFYSEDGNGGSGWFTGDTPEAEKKLMERIHEHYVKYPDVDSFRVYASKMTVDEYLEKRDSGTLPMNSYSDEGESSFVLDIFMSTLFSLLENEKSFKKAVRKGYRAYADVRYVHLPDIPVPVDEGYFTDGSPKSLAQIQADVDRKSPANTVTVYTSLDDFVIK